MPTKKDTQNNKNEMPLVSCILIFLNGEKFIAEAIESIRTQTYANWELVLVDDGTTDGATEIAKGFAAAHPEKITYIEHADHENRGMSASRNAGIDISKGKYVAFLDADDIWLPERLKTHVEVLETHPDVVMSMAPTLLWSSWRGKPPQKRRPWLTTDFETTLDFPELVTLQPPMVATNILEGHSAGMPGICSVTIRLDKLREVGCFDPAFRALYEDQVMLFKMFLNFPVMVIDQVQDYYRQHDGSACAQEGRLSGDRAGRPVFLEWLRKYLVKENFTDTALWDAYQGQVDILNEPKWIWTTLIRNAVYDRWNLSFKRTLVWLLTPKYFRKLRSFAGRPDVDSLHLGVRVSDPPAKKQ